MNLGHGGNVSEISRKYNMDEESIIDFSANINPLGLSPIVKRSMVEALDNIERYPDITYYDLKNALKKYEGIEEDNIILGNGAAEVIFNIARALKPKKVLLPAPTFSEYEDSILSVNGEVEHYKLSGDFSINEGFLNRINDNIDMTFICNPNNPTGVLTERKLLIDIIEKAKIYNVIVVIDESFIDFIEEKNQYSLIKLVHKYDNIIVVKSLTKFYAFPGIRVGYGVTANNYYINRINKITIPWAINTVATKGAVTALRQEGYIRKSIGYVKKERLFLLSELKKINMIEVFEPSVNFIFFRLKESINLKEKLIKKGILIRSCNNYIGLDNNYYRVAVRTREENIKLITALRKVL